MKEKLKVWLTIVVFLSCMAGAILLLMHKGDLERNYNLQKVKKNYQIAKGMITQISSYKGHSVHIKYHVNTIEYNYEGGFATNPNGLGVADSIYIKYATDSPKYVISELDENYIHF